MKKFIIFISFLFIQFTSFSQDGIYCILDGWWKSNVVSTYNSSRDERFFVGDYFCGKISKKQKLTEGTYNFSNDEGTKIYGELFIYDEGRTILYDFYVDKIVYSDGRNYSVKRFDKPTQ